MRPKIFFDARGQEDNLGDSVLRRVYFDVLRRHGEMHVNCHNQSAGYLAAFPFCAEDRLYDSSVAWWGASRRLVRAGDLLTLNAGESMMEWARREYLKRCGSIAMAALRGGGVVHCGHGLRRNFPAWRWPLRAMLSGCRLVSWRDHDSRAWVGCGRVYPDWAFAAGQSDAEIQRSRREPRDLLVVALRGDRPEPSEEWLGTVASYARSRGLRIHLVTQVRRDQGRALHLAGYFGTDCLRWDDSDHRVHEVRVRAWYRRAALVISDRLHVLVVAMTEGAVPVGYTPNLAEKISRSFAGAGMPGIGFGAAGLGRDEALARIARLEADGDALFAALAAARRQLAALSARIGANFSGGDRPI